MDLSYGMEQRSMPSSFFPAARKVLNNPVVRWVVGSSIALLTAALTTGVWPFFRGWIVTRASTESVEAVEHRVTKLEYEHSIDFVRLDSARSDDTSKLTQAEQIQWSILRVKRIQMKLAIEVRYGVGLEARLRMPNPRSDAAKRIAASVRSKYDELMSKGEEDPTVAATKALDIVFGSEEVN